MHRLGPLGSLALGAELSLLAAAAASPPAHAAPSVAVSAVVETDDAIFFQPTAFPNVVWFFPRSEIRLAPALPPQPGANFWRASVDLVDVAVGDLSALRPDWRGKSLVAYIVRPETECLLLRVPEMRFVQQELRARGRDVSAAIDLPACQFSFRLPLVIPAELAERLEALRSSGALIDHDLPVSLLLSSAIAWSTVHGAVADALGDALEVSPAEALAAIELALESEALAAVSAAMTDDERAAFLDAALDQLFLAGEAEGALVLGRSPAGQLVYHTERIDRSM